MNKMEQTFSEILGLIDPILIVPYRWMGDSMLGFLIGTFCLCLLGVMLGEFSISAGIRLNRRYIQALKDELAHKEKLSVQAYAEDDKVSYKALNKAANEAWGKYFFIMAGYSAGILWPVPLALAWMQTRFQGVEFEMIFPLNYRVRGPRGLPLRLLPHVHSCPDRLQIPAAAAALLQRGPGHARRGTGPQRRLSRGFPSVPPDAAVMPKGCAGVRCAVDPRGIGGCPETISPCTEILL